LSQKLAPIAAASSTIRQPTCSQCEVCLRVNIKFRK